MKTYIRVFHTLVYRILEQFKVFSVLTVFCTASLTAVGIASVLSSTRTMKDNSEETSPKLKSKHNTITEFIASNCTD